MKYAVVDLATNKVLWTGLCSDEGTMALQAQTGQLSLDVSAVEPDMPHLDNNLYVYDPAAKEVVARQAMLASAPATAAVGAAVSVTGPAGAELFVDGVSHGALANGAEDVAFADAGTYEVRLSLWPWLDAVFSVVVA